ncbi:MAG TPA: hypothetical protein VK116_06295, partial [Planctomycetota bacterium]|nr:hypothetical protein [Planctomycetota bacterium]
HEGLSILSATSRGTDVDGYFHEGFEQTEITTGPGNAGFVSIVVLSFEDLVTLPPDGEFIIARAGYRATRNGCRDGARIEARDGLEGTGAPVRNIVSFNGTSVRPAVEALSWPACEPARFALEIDGDATKVVRPGAAGDDSEDAGGDDDLTIRARVVFRQDVPSARAFTLAIAHDPAKLELFEAAIAADGIASSIAEDGFALVELTRGGGNAGVVAHIELSSSNRAWLSVPEETLLELEYRLRAAPAPGERFTTSIAFAESLRGSGGPVTSSVLPAGELETMPLEIEVIGYRSPSFSRGDANGDGNLDLADPIATLSFLFFGAREVCRSAADTNADSSLDLADAIYALGFLFTGGPPPPPPFPDCGDVAEESEACEETACAT